MSPAHFPHVFRTSVLEFALVLLGCPCADPSCVVRLLTLLSHFPPLCLFVFLPGDSPNFTPLVFCDPTSKKNFF